MCWRRKTELVPITSDHVYLGFGINAYHGSPLDGCINDIEDEIKKLKNEFPTFQCIKYFDQKVTTQLFVSEIRRVFNEVKQGHLYLKYSGHGTQIPSSSEPNGYNEALYLINGPLIDDVIYQLQQETPPLLKVTAKFDSCFSGDMGSRDFDNPKRKNRFFQLPGIPLMHKPHNRLAKTDPDQKWVIISGSGEEQTSADAWFNDRANGAFTYYDLKSYFYFTIYSDEVKNVNNYLLQSDFDQRPELSGPSNRLNEIVLI